MADGWVDWVPIFGPKIHISLKFILHHCLGGLLFSLRGTLNTIFGPLPTSFEFIVIHVALFFKYFLKVTPCVKLCNRILWNEISCEVDIRIIFFHHPFTFFTNFSTREQEKLYNWKILEFYSPFPQIVIWICYWPCLWGELLGFWCFIVNHLIKIVEVYYNLGKSLLSNFHLPADD